MLLINVFSATSNATSLIECDSYTWPINGTTYTSNGSGEVVDYSNIVEGSLLW